MLGQCKWKDHHQGGGRWQAELQTKERRVWSYCKSRKREDPQQLMKVQFFAGSSLEKEVNTFILIFTFFDKHDFKASCTLKQVVSLWFHSRLLSALCVNNLQQQLLLTHLTAPPFLSHTNHHKLISRTFSGLTLPSQDRPRSLTTGGNLICTCTSPTRQPSGVTSNNINTNNISSFLHKKLKGCFFVYSLKSKKLFPSTCLLEPFLAIHQIDALAFLMIFENESYSLQYIVDLCFYDPLILGLCSMDSLFLVCFFFLLNWKDRGPFFIWSVWVFYKTYLRQYSYNWFNEKFS